MYAVCVVYVFISIYTYEIYSTIGNIWQTCVQFEYYGYEIVNFTS